MTGIRWTAMLHPRRAAQVADLFAAVHARDWLNRAAEITKAYRLRGLPPEGVARAMPGLPVQWQIYGGRRL